MNTLLLSKTGLNKLLFLVLLLMGSTISFSQFILDGSTLNPGDYTCGSSAISMTSGFVDGQTYTLTICAAPGEVISLDLGTIVLNNNGGAGNDDYFTITDTGSLSYSDGTGSTGNSGVTVTGTVGGGCITISFTCQDDIPQPQFNATINCIPAPDAGPDQNPGDCSTSTTLAGNDLSPATGTWSVNPSAGVTITNPNDPMSTVTGMTAGTIYTFTWSDGSATDQMIFNSAGPGCAIYCTDPSPYTSSTPGYISNFTFNSTSNPINNSTAWAAYSDFTGTCAVVSQGETVNFSYTITEAAAYLMYNAMYIDWNGDGDFDDTDEAIDLGTTSSSGANVISGSINIPCDATTNGSFRIRLVTQYNAATDPCSSSSIYGEVEDYCISVLPTTTPTAAAGPDQNISCVTSATLAGNAVVSPNTGMWTLVSGSGTFADPTMNNTIVSGLSVGANVFEWTTSSYCGSTSDQVTINVSGIPNENVDAGIDLYTCNSSEILSGSDPSPYTGQWVVLSGPSVPTFTPNDTDPNATIGNLVNGTYSIEWQVNTGGACGILSDALIINHGSLPAANAGGDQTVCPESAILDATPVAGITGTWTISGGGGLVDANNPSTTAYNLAVGSYTATWTLTGGGCPGSTSDDMIITVNNCQNPLQQSATEDQTVYGCNFQFTDDGGLAGDYSEDIVSTQTVICPDSPDQYVTIDFTSIDLSSYIYDNLVVLESTNPMAAMIGYADGANESQLVNPAAGDPISTQYTSGTAGGCLVVIFTSADVSAGDDAGAGWVANTGCSTTPGAPITDYILGSNCGGLGGITLCDQTSNISPETSFQGGQMDLNIGSGTGNNGCLGSGESNEQWVYFSVISDGDIQFTFDVAGGQDFDFAIWGPYDYGSCPLNTGDAPIRCSWAVTGTNGCTGTELTGLAWTTPAAVSSNPNVSTIGDYSEDGTGCVDPDGNGENDGFVEPIQAVAGQTYTMLINNYSNNNSSYTFDYNGTAGLGCDPPLVLGVEMMDFTGTTDGRFNKLFWKTASEDENSHFVVEASTNGMIWQEIGKVQGNGTTQFENSYELEDTKLSVQLTYYRLRQVDFNGEFTVSQTIALVRDPKVNEVISSIFPNPSQGTLNFNYGGNDYNTPLEIKIYNNLGQLVYYNTKENFNKHVLISFDVLQLVNGVYNVEVRQGDKFEVQKVVLNK